MPSGPFCTAGKGNFQALFTGARASARLCLEGASGVFTERDQTGPRGSGDSFLDRIPFVSWLGPSGKAGQEVGGFRVGFSEEAAPWLGHEE